MDDKERLREAEALLVEMLQYYTGWGANDVINDRVAAFLGDEWWKLDTSFLWPAEPEELEVATIAGPRVIGVEG